MQKGAVTLAPWWVHMSPYPLLDAKRLIWYLKFPGRGPQFQRSISSFSFYVFGCLGVNSCKLQIHPFTLPVGHDTPGSANLSWCPGCPSRHFLNMCSYHDWRPWVNSHFQIAFIGSRGIGVMCRPIWRHLKDDWSISISRDFTWFQDVRASHLSSMCKMPVGCLIAFRATIWLLQ